MRFRIGIFGILVALAIVIAPGLVSADPGGNDKTNGQDPSQEGSEEHGNKGGNSETAQLDDEDKGNGGHGDVKGNSHSNPDGGGVDKPYAAAGQDARTQGADYYDGNNGCGQDKRADGGGDDNNGNCGGQRSDPGTGGGGGGGGGGGTNPIPPVVVGTDPEDPQTNPVGPTIVISSSTSRVQPPVELSEGASSMDPASVEVAAAPVAAPAVSAPALATQPALIQEVLSSQQPRQAVLSGPPVSPPRAGDAGLAAAASKTSLDSQLLILGAVLTFTFAMLLIRRVRV